MEARRVFLWHPPRGGPAINLTDRHAGYRLMAGATGLDMVRHTYGQRRTPGRAGARTTSVQAEPREIDLPILVQANSASELRERLRRLARAMQPTEGPGRLQVIQPTGESRWVDAWYVDGLEGSEAREAKLPGRWFRGVIGLRADDPYARSHPIRVGWSLAPATVGWFPIIPIRLSASGIGARRTISNPGDVDAFCTIRIQGPGRDLVVRNRTTGKVAHLDYEIPADGPSAQITINTHRAAQSITDGYGINLFSYLTDDDPSLWSLLPGDNNIEVQLQSAGTSTEVIVEFEPLYESL